MKDLITKFVRNKHKNLIYLILIMGAVMMLFAGSLGGAEKQTPSSAVHEEERLCQILSKIQGVGEVSVMITYYDTQNYKKGDPTGAKGAIIAAEGAWDARIKNQLSQGVQAALNLPANKVYVYELAKQQ